MFYDLQPENIGHYLSLAFGYFSCTCFLFVYTPQIYKNYQLKSIEGLNISFPILWLIGDFFTITGAIMNQLIFTIVLIGILYGTMDILLLSQFFFFHQPKLQLHKTDPTESTPLLNESSSTSIFIPTETADLVTPRTSTSTITNKTIQKSSFLMGVGVLFLVGNFSPTKDNFTISKTPSFVIDTKTFITTVAAPMIPNPELYNGIKLGDVFGYISIILFMSARIPQILQNFRLKSVRGLEFMMFVLSLMGNFTYSLSILCESLEVDYLIRSFPWLVGSLGICAMDGMIICQFYFYPQEKRVDDLGGGFVN